MIEAVDNKFFKKDIDKVTCLLCKQYCKLKENQIGICGVNKNLNGKLVNLIYGQLVAKNIDPIEKKPLYHFLPGSKTLSIGTIGCNMQCPFCQNWHISQVRENSNAIEYTSPNTLINDAIKHNCKSIAYTYNEPTIFYPYAKDVATIAKENNIKNIFVTNGLESKEVIEDMKGNIDACNVDFKSINPEFYTKKLKAPFGILESMQLVKNMGIWLEITTLIVPGENDSEEDLNLMAKFISHNLGTETPWHISAFYPNYKMMDKSRTSVSILEKAYQIGIENGLKHVYIGNLGLKNSTICPKCNAVFIERKGYHISINNSSSGKCQRCNHSIYGIWN